VKGFGETRGWKLPDVMLLLLMLVVTVLIGREPLADILHRANTNSTFAYIFLVPLAGAYLVWLRRSRLQYVRFRPSLAGPALVALGLFMTWWGFERHVLISWHAGGFVAMLGCVVSMTGLRVLRQFMPAAVVLFMMVPMPGRITQAASIPLQSLATGMTEEFLRFFSVDVIKLGNQLLINGEPIAVGETCNGMSMLLTLGLVSFVFVFSLPLRNRARLVLILLSPVVALFCNVLRLVPTCLLFGLEEPTAAEAVYGWSGVAMVPLAVVMLMAVLILLRWLDLPITRWRLVTA
jgi:exosortase